MPKLIFLFAIVSILLVFLSMEKKYVIQTAVDGVSNSQIQVDKKITTDVYNASDTVFMEIGGRLQGPNAVAILQLHSPLGNLRNTIGGSVYFLENARILLAKDLKSNHKEYTYSITVAGVAYYQKVTLDLKATVNDIGNTVIISVLGVLSSLLSIYELWKKK